MSIRIILIVFVTCNMEIIYIEPSQFVIVVTHYISVYYSRLIMLMFFSVNNSVIETVILNLCEIQYFVCYAHIMC